MIKSLALLLILLCVNSYGQTRLFGTVIDEQKSPLSFATVSLLQKKDSTLLAYHTTDELGHYQIHSDHTGELLIQASFVGYQSEFKKITINDSTSHLQDFILKRDSSLLDEILIKTTNTGTQYASDTIRYRVKNFVDGTEVNLEDVLNKLPGLEVDEKGRIKASGKTVDQVLINGQNYFANNTQIASKNLPAESIENIEVLNNYSEYSLLKGFQSREQTVINVAVNQRWIDKLSGKISIHGGVKDAYDTKLNLMTIQPKYFLTLLSSQNSIGKEVFSIEDYLKLQGGLGEVLTEDHSIELSEEEKQLLSPQKNKYKQANGLSALNFNYQPKNHFKINSYLLYHHNKSQWRYSNLYTYPHDVFTEEETVQNDLSRLYTAAVKIHYEKSPKTTLAYNGVISNHRLTQNNDIDFQFTHTANHFYEDRTSKSLKINNNITAITQIADNLLITEGKINYRQLPAHYALHYDSLFYTPVTFLEPTFKQLIQQRNRKDIQLGGSLAFLYRLGDQHFFHVKAYTELTSSTSITKLDQNPAYTQDINDLHLQTHGYGSAISWNKNKGLLRYKVGTAFDFYNFKKNSATSASLFKINPFANFSLYLDEKHHLNLSYQKKTKANEVDLFIEKPIIENFNTWYVPGTFLETHYSEQDFKLRYHFFESFSNTLIVAIFNYHIQQHPSTKNITHDKFVSTYERIASPQTKQLYLNLLVNKNLNVIPWAVVLKGSYLKHRFYNYISARENKQIVGKSTVGLTLKSNYKKPLNTEVFYHFEYQKSQSTIHPPFHQAVQSWGAKLIYKINKSLLFDLQYAYKTNTLSLYDRNTFYLLEGKLSYKMSKRFELSLIGDNLFHLNKLDWSTIGYREDYIIKNNFAQIPGYVLLGVNYTL
ncbi:carboxypeptidase-like regulatory domain-containing protein [Flavobacterium sp. JP2137]|uniref:carboxypeptidase-like regulatory domain-containing protein n=1 Tax=Flavobacterium sp. JP2137 TaxID=3414510 RepID=UPI003D2FC2DA